MRGFHIRILLLLLNFVIIAQTFVSAAQFSNSHLLISEQNSDKSLDTGTYVSSMFDHNALHTDPLYLETESEEDTEETDSELDDQLPHGNILIDRDSPSQSYFLSHVSDQTTLKTNQRLFILNESFLI